VKPRQAEHQAAPAHRRSGKPLVILATAGQRHEVTQLVRLLDQGTVKRTSASGRGPGRTSHPGDPCSVGTGLLLADW
jgi:hypothetical protein